MDWAVEKVILMAGLRVEDATPELRSIARSCVDRCYYLDRAAEEFIRYLDKR